MSSIFFHVFFSVQSRVLTFLEHGDFVTDQIRSLFLQCLVEMHQKLMTSECTVSMQSRQERIFPWMDIHFEFATFHILEKYPFSFFK